MQHSRSPDSSTWLSTTRLFILAADEATPAGWAAAGAAGAAAVQRYSGAAAGDRTMLDAILPAIEALRDHGGGRQWHLFGRTRTMLACQSCVIAGLIAVGDLRAALSC
jgi:hypothetical protein